MIFFLDCRVYLHIILTYLVTYFDYLSPHFFIFLSPYPSINLYHNYYREIQPLTLFLSLFLYLFVLHSLFFFYFFKHEIKTGYDIIHDKTKYDKLILMLVFSWKVMQFFFFYIYIYIYKMMFRCRNGVKKITSNKKS